MKLSDRMGRRIKLQDLHVLMAVAQEGSMNKAAALLNTTQPAISRSISDLEHAIGVRLLDRSRQGVEPTPYGRALLDGGAAVFDELCQAVKNIEFLADPTVGHITAGGNDVAIAGLLASGFGRLRRQHPGISIHVTPVFSAAQQYRELRERKVDLVAGPIASAIEDDIDAEILFHDRIIVVASPTSKWLRRRKVELSELAGELWHVPSPNIHTGLLATDAFRACGMKYPPRGAATGSFHLLSALLSSGPALSIIPASMLKLCANLPPLKILPVTLPDVLWPVGIMTLRNRTTNPATKLFISCARDIAKSLNKGR